MKYYLDTEFIEGFHKPLFGKRRHHIDLISIGVVREDGESYYAICSDYEYKDADEWVKKNVILPMYLDTVFGDARNHYDASNFHKIYGKKKSVIVQELLEFFGCWRDVHFWRASKEVEIYGYYADYDWVLFCSLFGRMIDLPKGFPMYCKDLNQMVDEKAESLITKGKGTHSEGNKWYAENMGEALSYIKALPNYPKQEKEHNALEDAKWNKKLHEFLTETD